MGQPGKSAFRAGRRKKRVKIMEENTVSFPRTTVAGVSLPRLLIGSNWMFGWSHTGHAADTMIKEAHSTVDATLKVINAFLRYGIDAWMAPFSSVPDCLDKIRRIQDKIGKKLILIDTPILNMDNTEAARRETLDIIKVSKEIGCTFCLIHHSSVEQLVNKNKKIIDRLPDYTDMIRQNGLIPGLSAHMPEIIQYADLNGYDVETYIQIFNCLGFMMQVEVESVIRIIHEAKKPVMTIKPMAAGRITPYIGLTFNWNVIRPQDMITCGCISEYEADEDVEISMAALEKRLPKLEGRGSPGKTSIIK
jgi:KaiC/GvpD/RAD55 family RecA-like ATPase